MPHRLAGLRVLLVDDEPDSLEITRMILEGEGATIRCVSTADEGIAVVAAERPDVILSDVAMPEHDGFWLLRSVKALPSGSDIPVAALTAHASAATRDEVLRAGFSLHLSKPADPETLITAVQTLSRRKRTR